MRGCRGNTRLAFFSELLASNERPDATAVSALINAYGRGGQWERTLQLLTGLDRGEASFVPDVIVYNGAIECCSTGLQWTHVLRLLGKMRHDGLRPNLVTYNSSISAFEEGPWTRALSLFYDMQQDRLTPDDISYGALLSTFEDDWARALHMYCDMQARRLPPSHYAQASLLNVCIHGSNVPMAVNLFRTASFLERPDLAWAVAVLRPQWSRDV